MNSATMQLPTEVEVSTELPYMVRFVDESDIASCLKARIEVDSDAEGDLHVHVGAADLMVAGKRLSVMAIRQGAGDGDCAVSGKGEGTAWRRGSGYGDARRTGSGAGGAWRGGVGFGGAYRGGAGAGDAIRNGYGRGDVTRAGSGKGDAYREGDGPGNAWRSGAGAGNAIREGAGPGEAARRGTGEGGAYRWGSGYGDAVCTSEGEGDAVRAGSGEGDALRSFAGVANGNAVRSGPGNGHAIRSGGGKGEAKREGLGEGDAVRGGEGEGDAVHRGQGGGKALRRGGGDGNAIYQGTAHGRAVVEGAGGGEAIRRARVWRVGGVDLKYPKLPVTLEACEELAGPFLAGWVRDNPSEDLAYEWEVREISGGHANTIVQALCVENPENAAAVVVGTPALLKQEIEGMYSDKVRGAACEAVFARVDDAVYAKWQGKKPPEPLQTRAPESGVFENCIERVRAAALASEAASAVTENFDLAAAKEAARISVEIVGALDDAEVCSAYAEAEDLWDKEGGDGRTLGERMRRALRQELAQHGWECMAYEARLEAERLKESAGHAQGDAVRSGSGAGHAFDGGEEENATAAEGPAV